MEDLFYPAGQSSDSVQQPADIDSKTLLNIIIIGANNMSVECNTIVSVYTT